MSVTFADLLAGRFGVVDLGAVSPPTPVLASQLSAAGWDVMVLDGRRVLDRASAFAAVAVAIGAEHMGGNLDALADVLDDLSWRPEQPHILVWTHAARRRNLDDTLAEGIDQVLAEVAASSRCATLLC